LRRCHKTLVCRFYGLSINLNHPIEPLFYQATKTIFTAFKLGLKASDTHICAVLEIKGANRLPAAKIPYFSSSYNRLVKI
jgi:hypothetical protein